MKLFVMRKVILTIIVVVSVNWITAQKKVYVQKEIDTFQIVPTTRENILVYKKMLESNKSLNGWGYYYSKIGMLHLIENRLDSCYIYSNLAIKLYNSSEILTEIDKKKLARAYYNAGRALRIFYKDYNQSLDYLIKALKLIDSKSANRSFSKNIKGYILKEISSNHMQMGDNDLALEYLLKASIDTNYLKNPRNFGPLYNGIGTMYFQKGVVDSAKYFYKKALLDTIRGRKVTAHNNLGNLYRKTNKIDSALFHYLNSKELLDKHYDKTSTSSRDFSLANYGYVLMKEKKYTESVLMLRTVLDSVNAYKSFDKIDKDIKVTIMDYLIEAYQKNNQLSEALGISEQKSNFLEKFHKQMLEEKLRELNVAYRVKEKDESIQQLEATTEEQNTVIKQRNLFSIVLIGLLLSIVGIGFLVFRQRKLNNKYQTTNLEQRLLRSQLNPHFVFNALNTVSSLANKKSEKTSSYIAKLSSLIRLILKNSREEFVSLGDELKSIEDYLELQSNFSQKFKYRIAVPSNIDKEETFIPPMFIQPFIENSIEHGLRGANDGNINLDIKINEKDKLLECKITDNGIGVAGASEFKSKNGAEYESFSGKILKERLQIYSRSLNKKAKYTTQSLSKGKGTEVSISLPYILE